MSSIQVLAGLILLALLALVAFLLSKMVFFIGEQHYGNVERFRKYHRTVESGLHFRIPFLEEVKEGTLQTVRIDIPNVEVVSRNTVRTEWDIVVFGQVVDSYKASYNIVGLNGSIKQLIGNVLQEVVPKMNAAQALSSFGRERIIRKITQELDTQAAAWGFDTQKVGIDDLRLTGKVQEAYEDVSAAEQRAQAQEIEAKGPAGAFNVILKLTGQNTALARGIMELNALTKASNQGLLPMYLMKQLFGGHDNDPQQ